MYVSSLAFVRRRVAAEYIAYFSLSLGFDVKRNIVRARYSIDFQLLSNIWRTVVQARLELSARARSLGHEMNTATGDLKRNSTPRDEGVSGGWNSCRGSR